MKNVKIKKSLLFFAAFVGMFVLFLSGFAAYYSSPAYSQGYYGVGVATPNFAFSFGSGVNAYEAPMYGGYVYGYNGYYYRWFNDGWVYSNVYAGPWYPVAAGIYLPGILAFGPPPPVVAYPGYFTWWTNHVGPWYRAYHPGWWARHQMFLRNYGEWRSHVNSFYRNHPYQNWRMRRPFRQGGQGYRGQGQRGRMQPGYRGQGQRGRMQPGYRGQGQRGPVQPGYRGQVQHGRPMQQGPVSKGRANKGGHRKKHRNNESR